jgi:hypothetical protein
MRMGHERKRRITEHGKRKRIEDGRGGLQRMKRGDQRIG